ncbi:MAG: penicillin acylase family protein [Gemmatimonadota bacterium]
MADRRRVVRLVGSGVALAAALHLGARGMPGIPPLGPLLDPGRGLWSAVSSGDLPVAATVSLPGATDRVEVRYDVRGVPHIFARNEEDLMRALGYVTARDRLFQLELQARAGAGTLTELAGSLALEADRETRSLGLPRAAEVTAADLAPGSVTRRHIDAYAQGVNAWISQLKEAEIPVEFKLLGTRPARWRAINSLHLFNRMGYTLSWSPEEERRSAVRTLIGAEATEALFPLTSPIQEPIQPAGRDRPRFELAPLPPPPPGINGASGIAVEVQGAADGDPRRFASNNWAVGARRSRTGTPLLAGDPHLELTLPSIWYEAHLVIADRLDVYGVSIPGAPGIIIGFTPDLAWSLTNTGADVHDFYRETVDDQERPRRYLVDSVWRSLELREETYRDQRGRVIAIDTLRFTHRGPLNRTPSGWLSMRWTVLEAANVVAPFFNGARARGAREFLDAFAADFRAPAQNVIVADRAGNIAIRSTGRFPIRPGNGDGLGVFDGTRSSSDWIGFLPVSRYPQSFNPPQGYLASANQQPIDPALDPTYYGPENAFEPWRALQINKLLRADSSLTIDKMQLLQTHPGSVRADLFMERVLAATASGRAAGGALAAADSLLRDWDRLYTRDNTGALLFEATLTEIARRTWDELIPAGDSVRLATPSGATLLRLLADPGSLWWDDRRTAGRREGRDDIIRESVISAWNELRRRYGSPAAWEWGEVAPSRINHLLGLSGFSERAVVQGGRGTLNPSAQSNFGASWRMVVELGQRVRGFGTYPGGQSGNPASPRYSDRLRFWAAGELELLHAPPALDSMPPAQIRSSLTLTPGPG